MNIIQKRNQAAMIIAIIMITLSFPLIANATTYSSSISFVGYVKGDVRSYSAGNMSCSMTALCPIGNKSFYVTCYKYVTFGADPKVGTTKTYSASESGIFNSRYFGSGVAAAKYYFVFEMTENSGVPVVSNNVHMSTN